MEGPRISFVTWPDGKVSGESLTVGGETNARHRHVTSWFPRDLLGDPGWSALDSLWRGMEAKGFRSHTIEIGADGQPVLSE